jgi:hypothetical protein
VEFEFNGIKPINAKFELHPGVTQKWGKISLTAMSVSPPPAPILNTYFVTNGRSVALFDKSLPIDLHCPDSIQAQNMNCNLSHEACAECFPNHEDSEVECRCRNSKVESVFEDSQKRLPISIAHFELKNDGPKVWAEHHYSPIMLNIEMKNYSFWTELQDSKCFVKPISLNGCYKCSLGAEFIFSCHTDWGTTLANIRCADGKLFALTCNINETVTKQNLYFTNSLVNMSCVIMR